MWVIVVSVLGKPSLRILEDILSIPGALLDVNYKDVFKNERDAWGSSRLITKQKFELSSMRLLVLLNLIKL